VPDVNVDDPETLQLPLGRGDPIWMEPAWSATKVASHLRAGFHYKQRGPIRQRIGPRGLRKVDYDRVTVYWPHAVNWIVTVVDAVPLVTTAVSVPESNRGSTVQLGL